MGEMGDPEAAIKMVRLVFFLSNTTIYKLITNSRHNVWRSEKLASLKILLLMCPL